MKALFATVAFLPLALATGSETTSLSAPPQALLKADGPILRDAAGKVVQLRGVNLGGWLKLESWMCPVDSSGTLRDGNPGHNGYDFEVRRLLARRFGEKTARELLAVYEDAWITAADLDNIKALGLNCVRLPLAWSTLLNEDGTWRPDAFARSDWLVNEGWKRGIYTVLDLHAFLPPGADHDGSSGGYFASAPQKAETARLWAGIAEHYRGHPAVAMYDLLNEPNNSAPKGKPGPEAAAICDLYDQIYKAIRKVDAEHIIAMEGLWGWDALRDPAKCGYRNVVYSFHWYHWGTRGSFDNNRSSDGDVRSAAKMQEMWGIPVLVGEFNFFGDPQAWRYGLAEYDWRGLSWTIWSYKQTGSGDNSWGVYTTIPGKRPAVPNLAKDSAEEIRRKWNAWRTTPETFALNPMLRPVLAAAAAVGRVVTRPVQPGLPEFRYRGVVLEAAMLKYRPHDDVIYPAVVRVAGRMEKPLGKFYMYYAPHDVPGGICLAYADKPEGPWREYEHNPIVANVWPPHYKVSHVSGPDAIWSESEHKMLLYFHGENPVTRVASSGDGVHFDYEGEAVTTAMFPDTSEASYGRVFEHRLPGKDNTYVMLLMGNNRGTRRIYLAWSKDGRKWEPRPQAWIDPPPGNDQAAGAVLVAWGGKLYVVLHANNSQAKGVANVGLNFGFDLYLFETDAALERATYLGKFCDHALVSPTNPGVMSPCFVDDGGRWYMFFNVGARLHNKIALAVAEPIPPAAVKP